jgi:serine/threonine-protein kinase
MALASGTRLGSYEITHVLGAGGMGEVYRARDGKLGRSVAIKVILETFGSQPDRVARFQREAKVLASINHPNIAALYGMEESNGQHFLVMELVEGETLADRLQRGPIPIEEALRVALQIAEALEAAHDKNITHRDLKPANIKITPDDKVKVLDFGLAKATESDRGVASDAANSPTLSIMATNAGIILGTAAYMSPEQAKGFSADHRSDVFSFGVVFYEMLTGRRPFQGETAPDVLASVLVREPEMQLLPADLNPRIPELLRRCLEKNPKRRWQAIGDLRAEIEALAAFPRASSFHHADAAPPPPLWRRAMPIALASVVTGVIAAAAAWHLKPVPPRELTRFVVALPDSQRFTGVTRRPIDVSPDGRHLVYAANGQLFLRSMSGLTNDPIKGTETHQNAVGPVFSPDGRHIAFYAAADQTLKRIAIGGGAAATVCPILDYPIAVTWVDDSILFSQGDAVMRVSAEGGQPEKLVSVDEKVRVQSVQVLPGGETVLLTMADSTGSAWDQWSHARIVAHSLRSGQRKTLIATGSNGWYLPTGHLTYVVGGTLHAVAFDVGRLEVTGTPAPIVEGLRRSSLASSGIAWLGVSNSGTLVYVPGPSNISAGQLNIGVVDRNGTVTPLRTPPAPYEYPRVSLDGTRIAVGTDDGKEAVVLIYDLSRSSALQRFTFGGRNRFPVWTSDSKRIVFQSDREGDLGIFWQAADGTSVAERLTTAPAGESHIPESWQPRGEVLLFSVAKGSEYSLWMYSVRDRKPMAFGGVQSSTPIDATFSPDGKWVAYTSGSSRISSTIYVQPFPATGAMYQLVPEGRGVPHHPLWSPDGKELIFNARAGFVDTVSVSTSPMFAFGNRASVPRRVGTGPPGVRRAYDMMPDGRIVGLTTPGDVESGPGFQQINVVLNWFDELKARVPGR